MKGSLLGTFWNSVSSRPNLSATEHFEAFGAALFLFLDSLICSEAELALASKIFFVSVSIPTSDWMLRRIL